MTASLPSARGSFLAGPAWSLPAYLAIGLLLRAPAVWCAHGFDFVDQQYQYIDPAWHAATGHAWYRSWEWLDGIRSWIYPGLLAGILRALQAVGFEDAIATMRAVRLVHAVFSLLPLWAFWNVAVRWHAVPRPRLPLLLFAASGLLLGGVQPSGPSVASTLVITAGLCLAGGSRHATVAGLCLGFAFCARFQDALFGPGFLLALLWQRRWGASACFALGCVPGIGAQALADWCNDGSLLGTPWRCFVDNIEWGSARKWKTQPFLFYVYAGVVPLLFLVPGCLRTALARLAAGTRVLPAAAVGALVHLVVHSFIARKALRFEHGALSLLFAAMLVGLARGTGLRARWHTVGLCCVHGALALYASFWFGNAGAVQLAMWLQRQPDFDGRVVVVGGDASSLGGAFYLRVPQLTASTVQRPQLVAWLRANRAAAGAYVVAIRDPLSAEDAAVAQCTPVASFAGHFDLRQGERRFVYRRGE